MNALRWEYWSWPVLPLVLAAGLAVGYYWLSDGRWQRGGGAYFAGLGLFVLVETSPLHFLGMHALFSAHMAGHVALLLLAGPLLVLGLPPTPRPRAARRLAAFSRWLRGRVPLAWAAGVGLMWVLHVPAVFDASFAGMDNPLSPVPLLHAAALLAAGALFSWPLFGPVAGCHVHPLAGVVYLFTACAACSLLGLLVTFAPYGTYRHYLTAAPAVCGTLDLGAAPWGLTRTADQQLAGLIMWVPCCFIYLGGCVFLLARYFAEPTETTGAPVGG